MLMCPSSAPRVEGKAAVATTAPPLPGNGTAGLGRSGARMVASAPSIGVAAAAFATSSQVCPAKQQRLVPPSTGASAAAPVKQVLVNGSTTIRQKATPPTLLSRTTLSPVPPSGTYSEPQQQQTAQSSNSATNNDDVFRANCSSIPSEPASQAAANGNSRNQPKFKLLQRPKLPRGHKPPPSQDAADSFNSVAMSMNNPPGGISFTGYDYGGIRSAQPTALGDGGGFLRAFASTSLTTDSDHKEGHTSAEELHRISLYTTDGNAETDTARKIKQIESMRSLRERERLYEEAKRRIWTSTNRKAMGLQQQSPQPGASQQSSDGQVFHRGGGLAIDCSPSNGHTAGDLATADSILMIPPPPPPLYEYEPPFQPGTYYITDDGLESCQRQPLLTQTFDEYDTRRPVPRGEGAARNVINNNNNNNCIINKSPPSSSKGGGAGNIMAAACGLPLVVDGYHSGRPNYLHRPVSGGGGSNNGFESATPSHGLWDGTAPGDSNFCSRHPEQQQQQLVIQPPIVEPWELVRAEPPSNNGDAPSTGSTSRLHINTTPNNGPPPLEDDFSFPPLGRTAAADNQFHPPRQTPN